MIGKMLPRITKRAAEIATPAPKAGFSFTIINPSANVRHKKIHQCYVKDHHRTETFSCFMATNLFKD